MPKRPSAAPSTALGAWLTAWLEGHPEWTHGALAKDIGVSKGLISQWSTGAVKTISPPNLAGLARVTQTDLGFLEGLVYGTRAPERAAVSPAMQEAIAAAVAQELRPLVERIDQLLELLAARPDA